MTRFGLENKILERQRGWEDQGGKEQELIQLSIGLFMVKNEKYSRMKSTRVREQAWHGGQHGLACTKQGRSVG